MISALLGFDNESQFVRYAHAHLRPWFPYLPNRDGYNKRLRRSAEMIVGVMEWLARECESWHDDVWLVDSTPVECGTSRETQKRSDLARWAQYGWCASHSRWFWGLRLHLVATPAGLPIAFALAGAKADERDVCADMIDAARPRPAGPDPHRRQPLPLHSVRSRPQQHRHHRAAPRHPIRGPAARRKVPAAPAPDHRIDQPDPQRPAHPRTPQRHAPKPASPCASAPASSPSPPPSGTTRPTDTPDQHAH